MKLMKFTIFSALLALAAAIPAHSAELPENTPPDALVEHRIPVVMQAFAKIGLSYLYGVQKSAHAVSGSYDPGSPEPAFEKLPVPDYYLFGLVTGCPSKGQPIELKYVKTPGPAAPLMRGKTEEAKAVASRIFADSCVDDKNEFLAFAVGNVDGKPEFDVWTENQERKIINVHPSIKPGTVFRDKYKSYKLMSDDVHRNLKIMRSYVDAALHAISTDLRRRADGLDAKAKQLHDEQSSAH